MNQQTTPSRAAIAAVAVLTLLGLVGGWLILLGEGFHHQPSRFSRETMFVSGPPALVMAASFFLMAAIGIASVIQQTRANWAWGVIGCGGVLVPPLLFTLLS